MLRGRTPKDSVIAPELKGGYVVWWIAYQDLMTNRPISPTGTILSIPEREIRAYARDRGLDLDLLKPIIWGVDEKFIEIQKRRQEAEAQTREAGRRR